MTLLGLDVSNVQEQPVDAARAKAEGCTFIGIKASQGTARSGIFAKDRFFAENVLRAREAGLTVLAYHFLLNGYDTDISTTQTEAGGRAEADNFLAQLQAVGGGEGIVPCVDYEQFLATPGYRDPQPPTLAGWLDRVGETLGRWGRPLIYAADWYWSRHPTEAFSGHALWWANYLTGADVPPVGQRGPRRFVQSVTPGYFKAFGGWDRYLIRQFTSSGEAGGFREVDLNVMYADMPVLARHATREPPAEC